MITHYLSRDRRRSPQRGWYVGILSQQASSASVSVLLPRETIFLAHMQEFNRTRINGIIDLISSIANRLVQDFLRKPLRTFKKRCGLSTVREIGALDPKNAFVARHPSTIIAQNLWALPLPRQHRDTGASKSANGDRPFWEKKSGAKRENFNTSAPKSSSSQRLRLHSATDVRSPLFFASTDLTELRHCSIALTVVPGIQRRHSTTTKDIARQSLAGHRITRCFSTCNRRDLPNACRPAGCGPVVGGRQNSGTLCWKKCELFWCDALQNGKIHDLLFLGMRIGAERNTHPVFANAWTKRRSSIFDAGSIRGKIDTLNQAGRHRRRSAETVSGFSDSGSQRGLGKLHLAWNSAVRDRWPADRGRIGHNVPLMTLRSAVQSAIVIGTRVRCLDDLARWSHEWRDKLQTPMQSLRSSIRYERIAEFHAKCSFQSSVVIPLSEKPETVSALRRRCLPPDLGCRFFPRD